jgi:hypothetical protein
MSNFLRGHKLVECIISSPDESQRRDFRLDVGDIDYYESIFDYSISMNMMVGNAKGLFSNLPVRSGCRVTIKITHPSGDLVFNTENDGLYLSTINANFSEPTRELFSIKLEGREVFTNQSTRIYKKYTGKISDIVQNILKNDLKTNKINQIDLTSNVYSFMGNYKKPFQTLVWLCPKSIPVIEENSKETGSAGYFFYETLNGYNFRSIDSLFSQIRNGELTKNQNVFVYTYTPTSTAFDSRNNFRIVSTPVWANQNDILSQMRNGMYRSKNIYFDINSRRYETVDYNIKDSIGNQIKTANPKTFIPLNLVDESSRYMFTALDTGTLSPDGDLTTPQNQAFYQAQSVARYYTLFSQTLTITVPLNNQLRAGNIIYCQFPKVSTSAGDYGKDPNSGYYLITRLRHNYGTVGDFTGLELVRDSYGEYT